MNEGCDWKQMQAGAGDRTTCQVDELESIEKHTVNRKANYLQRKQKQLCKVGIQITGNGQLSYRK